MALLPKTKGALMILEEIQHHLDRIEAAQKRCEEQPTDVATIVVLLNALAMAVKDLLRESIPCVSDLAPAWIRRRSV